MKQFHLMPKELILYIQGYFHAVLIHTHALYVIKLADGQTFASIVSMSHWPHLLLFFLPAIINQFFKLIFICKSFSSKRSLDKELY